MPLLVATGLDEREVRSHLDPDPMCEVLEKPHDFYQVWTRLKRLGVALQQPDRTADLHFDRADPTFDG